MYFEHSQLSNTLPCPPHTLAQSDIVACGLAVWAHCFQMEMPKDWGHTQTHTHGHDLQQTQLESENTCNTFVFGLYPSIKTVAPPFFSYFHCQITRAACLSWGCAAVREFLGKDYSMENIFRGITQKVPFAFGLLLSASCAKVEKVPFLISRQQPWHKAHFHCFVRFSANSATYWLFSSFFRPHGSFGSGCPPSWLTRHIKQHFYPIIKKMGLTLSPDKCEQLCSVLQYTVSYLSAVWCWCH